MKGTVRVRRGVVRELLAEARRAAAVECCGLLAGRDAVITRVLPAPNQLASPVAYEIAPRELFRLFRAMRAEGLEHLGIYHSHPETLNLPSERDLARAYYPDVAYFIVSPREGVPRPVRAFRVREGGWSELEVEEV